MRLKTQTGLVALIALAAAGILAATASAAAPVNTAPPTITGTQQQGKNLTATNGTWSNAPTSFFYRWQRCDTGGTGCVNIDNATKKTYLLTAADVDHTVRVVVTASNRDGQASANSQVTGVISGTTAPKNTAPPTVSGTPEIGEELTATRGTWTGGARSFSYQWQRCDVTGENCTDVTGAAGQTYGVRSADVAHTLRVVVTATNLAGSTSASSTVTSSVNEPTPTPSPSPSPSANKRPTVSILSVRFVGAKVYARFRACDDSRSNLRFTVRDSKPRAASAVRHFRTFVPPRSCTTLTRSWRAASRFRHGRYIVTIWARDRAGLVSRPATKTRFR